MVWGPAWARSTTSESRALAPARVQVPPGGGEGGVLLAFFKSKPTYDQHDHRDYIMPRATHAMGKSQSRKGYSPWETAPNYGRCCTATNPTASPSGSAARTFRACSTKTRAEASQLYLAANSRQACGEINSADRQASRRSSFSAPIGAVPMTSRGPVTGKAATRQAAGERFQQHETKCVGLARKHEHVGGRIGLRQRLALPRAEEDGLRIFSRQRGACRTARPLPNLSPGRRQTESELWQRGIALNFVGDHPRRKELLRSQNVLMHFSQGSANRSISGVRLRGDVADSFVDFK
jgi:hypothetical protein